MEYLSSCITQISSYMPSCRNTELMKLLNLFQEMRSATAVGKVTSTASSEDNSGIFDAQSNIPDSKAVNSSPDDEFLGFANPDEVKQSGCQILDRLESNSCTVKGALIIGQDNEALAHVLLPIKRCSQGSQNSSRHPDILTSNQCLRILSNLVAAGAITSSGLLDEILHEILAYTTFIVSIKSSELNELRAKSFSIIKVLVDNVEHDFGGSYFRHWVALADIFSQVVGCSEDASGRVMLESIACITVMLTRVNEGLKVLFSTPALQEVSGPNEAVKQILDHAKTSGLVDQLCLCLATAGASLISGSSDMLRSACEACRAIWLLVDASEIFSTKGNAVSFPLNTMRSPARDQDGGGSVIWTESAKFVAVVTRALVRSKPVQVAIHYCLHQHLEASLYAGIQLLLRCCLQSGIVPGILCGLPSSLRVTTVVSGGGDTTIISEIFSLLSSCISSQSKVPQAIETTNLKSKITDPNTLVLDSCLILASVAQCLKATGRNSALFMLTTSSKNQLSRLSVLAHHFSSGESTNTSSRAHSASAMLALASILSLESGASVGSSVFEVAVPLIPQTATLCEYLKLPSNSEIVSGPNGTSGVLSNWHGLRDGCVGLLEARLRWGGPSAVQQMCASNIPLLLINLLAKNQQYSSAEEESIASDQVGLSPIGVVWTVSSICQCLSGGALTFRQILLRSDHIKLFSDLISDVHLKLVKSWAGPGGGMDGVRDITNAIIDLLAFPFVAVQNAPGLPAATASVNSGILLNMGSPGVKVGMEDRDMLKVIEEDLGKYIKILLEVGVPGIILWCLEHLQLNGLGRPVAFLAKMIGLRPLAVQLLVKYLSDPTNMSKLLDRSSPKEVIPDVLMIISDLARMDKIGNPAYHNDLLFEEPLLLSNVAIQVKMGTTIAALLYDKGIVAFHDSRCTVTTTDPINGDRESIFDSSDKFHTISTRSNLFYLQCGNKYRNEQFLEYLVYVVADREQNGELVGVDLLAGIAQTYLKIYSIGEPENTFTIGGILIGWLSDKRYQAYKVLLHETNLHDLEHLNEITDLEALENIKQQLVLGSGSIFAHRMLRDMGAHPQITKDWAREASLVSAHYAGMCSNYTGGPTHLYYFPNEEGFNFELSHEEVGPCILHLRFPSVYSNCLLLVRITSLAAGPLTEFEQQMTSREGVTCTSLIVSKNGYNYYRVFCRTLKDVNTVFTEMTEHLVPKIDPESNTQPPEWCFKRVQYLLGNRLIYVDVAQYSEHLMREILAA